MPDEPVATEIPDAPAATLVTPETTPEQTTTISPDAATEVTTPKWNESISEDLRANPSMQNFKSTDDLAKAYLNAQSLIGKEKLILPTSDDDPTWKDVYKRLGMPDAPNGYQLAAPEGIPEDFVQPESQTGWSELAHKHGLSQRQAAGVYQDYVAQKHAEAEQGIAAHNQAVEEAEQALKREFGPAWDANKVLAEKTLRFAAGDAAPALAQKFGHDPDFMRAMITLGNELSEPILGAGSPRPDGYTPEAAQKQINAIQMNKEHAYHKKEHPDHAAAVEEMTRLFALVHGEELVT